MLMVSYQGKNIINTILLVKNNCYSKYLVTADKHLKCKKGNNIRKLKKDFIKNIDSVYLIKISEDLYSICQHRGNSFFEFFDIFFSNFDEEKKIDLNETKVLFTKSCAAHKFKDFFVEEITSIIPNNRTIETIYLHPFHYLFKELQNEGDINQYVSLIELTNIYKNIDYNVVIEQLDEQNNLQEIYKYSSFGMAGAGDKIQEELSNYVKTGILWGREKSTLFPTISIEILQKNIHSF